MRRNICLTAFTLFIVGCGADGKTVFSSRVSPDGSRVAESVMVGDGEEGGKLLIRAKDGSTWQIAFPKTAPDFCRESYRNFCHPSKG
jgi:hypothetical protein